MINRNIKLFTNAMLFIFCTFFSNSAVSQIEYNWQNSKEGWVSASETNNGCQLFAQPTSLAMRAFNATPIMRSGGQQDDLGIDATTYNQVEITLKNPNTSGSNENPNAILFVYPPGSNDKICSWKFAVDTGMTEYITYTIDLESEPDNGDLFEGPVARFGLRSPWGVANLDTVYWKKMKVYNTNTIELPEHEVFLNTFPNPSNGDLFIESNDPIASIEIKDLTGRVILEMAPQKSKVFIETSELKNDFYFLSCYINKEWITRKIILNQR
jgi:hypothetical protein